MSRIEITLYPGCEYELPDDIITNNNEHDIDMYDITGDETYACSGDDRLYTRSDAVSYSDTDVFISEGVELPINVEGEIYEDSYELYRYKNYILYDGVIYELPFNYTIIDKVYTRDGGESISLLLRQPSC